MDNFLKKYKDLNKEQKLAVDTIDGPVMVIAGPGTGKTTILTLRIANILRKTDTPPSGILAITFTDAGVKSMKMKLRDIIGTVADQVRIHTFHGLASSIISEFQDHFVHLAGSAQLNEIDSEEMIRNILDDLSSKDDRFDKLRPIGNTDFYIKHILSAISKAKNEAYMPDVVREFAENEIEKIKKDDSNISSRGATKGELKAEVKKRIEKCEKTILFSEIYERYEEKKRKDRKMDYDDLIIEVLSALENDELLLRLVQEKFLYILIDEHQDTNDSQNLLISLIAEFFEIPNVFIVGDEKQAIYRFQGASVQNFLRFRKAWPQMKLINLKDNYRSHQSILDASHSMIETNYRDGEYKELRTKLISGVKTHKARPIDIVSGTNNISIENYLIEQLKSIIKNKNESVAIITRTNRELENVLRVLETNDIKASALRNIDIFKHPLSIIFFDLLDFLVDPTNVEALSKTLVAKLWDLSFEDTIELTRILRSKNFYDHESFIAKQKNNNKKDIFDIYIPKLKNILNQINSEDIIGFLVNSAEQSGLNKIILKDPAYMEVWRGIINLAQAISREYEIRNVRELIKRLLAYRDSAESRSVKISVGTTDLPIQVMTAHGSKGLEFDHVYIMYANEESWMNRVHNQYFILPQSVRSDEEDDIRDSRRLFYVALTRAKKHVSVLHSIQDISGRNLTPLRFITELDINNTNFIELGSKYNDSQNNSRDKRVNKTDDIYKSKLIDHTKNIILEKGLSVTALNHFIECPAQFMIKSILKLPEAPVAVAEKGTAMHRAFDNIWHQRKDGEDSLDFNPNDIRKLMKDSIQEYLDSSLLPINEKKRVNKEISEKLDSISKSLVIHFNQKGKVFAETWSETTLNIGGKKIPIHGKLDAIIDTGKDILVFDYKTREKMSLGEIKGDTKNSNGNYMRQLVFYKLLLENDIRFAHKNIIPSLVFVMPDDRGNCSIVTLPINDIDIRKVKEEIGSLIETIWKGNIFDKRCGEERCEWEALIDFV